MTPRTPLLTALLPILLFSACHLPEKPVSDQEAGALAKKIESSVDQHNSGILDNIFDQKRFTQRILAEAHQPLNLTLAQAANSALQEIHWGQQVVGATEKGGSYSLIRQYEKEGHKHLLFRLYESSSAINYHDFELVKTDEGVKAIDVYVYMSGEDLTKTLSQSLVMMQDKLPDMSPEDQEKITRVRRINTLLKQGDYQKASEYYEDIPADLKKQKLFQLIHIRVASKMGDSIYIEALNEYKSNFPHDPNLYLLMLDAYVMEKDYPAAINAVNRLDSIVGKDPFQDYYRGLLYKLMKDTVESRICLERLHKNLPQFGKGTIELLANFATSGYPDSAAMLVRQAQKDSNVNAEEVQELKEAYPTIKPYLK
jgi:tetratricopeptide (TPR) repeat protein